MSHCHRRFAAQTTPWQGKGGLLLTWHEACCIAGMVVFATALMPFVSGCDVEKASVPAIDDPIPDGVRGTQEVPGRPRWRTLSDRAKADARRAEEKATEALDAAAGASQAETEARRATAAGDSAGQRRAAAGARGLAGTARAAAEEAAKAAGDARQAAEKAQGEARLLALGKDARPADVAEARQASEEAGSAATQAAESSGRASQYAALAERAARNADEATAATGSTSVASMPTGAGLRPSPSPNDRETAVRPAPPIGDIPSKTGLPALSVPAPGTKLPDAGHVGAKARETVAGPATRAAGAGSSPVGTEQTAGNAATQPEVPAAPRPRINMAELPKVPGLPAVQTRPAGILLASSAPSAPEEWNGTWVQIEGGSAADFLPGGYAASRLAFRDDGTIEFSRSYAGGAITRKWRIGFAWDPKTEILLVGSDPKKRPPAESLRGADVKALEDSISLATRELPVAFRITRPAGNRIQFDGKTYQRQASPE